ncbi:MAG: hypothetical protein ACI8ZB_003631 [Desulforhopalus sp.]|jgi:hypothetical protein
MEPKNNVTKLFFVCGGHRDILALSVATVVPVTSEIAKYINVIAVMHSGQ